MRCKNCNVDLPDSYTVCPLCHEKAVDEPAILDIPEAEYPKKYLKYKRPHSTDIPVKYSIRLGILISVIFGILSIFTIESIWSIAVPGIMIILAIFCLISSFYENSTLLHSFVALLSVIAFQSLFTIITIIAHIEPKFMVTALLIELVIALITFITKPKRTINQLQALFSL